MARKTMDTGTARHFLALANVERGANFHTLNSSKVVRLLEFADEYGYRKPKSANGSRGRYWHEYLQRVARREN